MPEDVKKSELNLNYSELKFKAGLEIHQQLDSSKIYCNCPSLLRKDEPDLEIKRKLHAVAGEKGEVDVAALYQASLGKEFIYQFYKNSNCLVELDEEPPHEINKQALKIAIQISLLLNCKIIPITQIMRKTVIDGSNTSGFQRSVLIGYDGYVEVGKEKIRIEYVYLEEDAARIIEKQEKQVIYRLDRLGIPLVEIVTAPELKTPEQAKEVALKIGEILRMCKVKRGIGTIRQDVNISIRGGNRVEIKGMQDMDIFLDVLKNEVVRQKTLSDSKKPVSMEVRNALKNGETEYSRPLPGSSRMYPETDLPLLKIHLDLINESKKDLPKLKTEVEDELKKKGLNAEMIKLLFSKGRIEEFKEFLTIINNPQVVVKTLLLFPNEIAKKCEKNIEELNEILNKDVLAFVLQSLEKKLISEAHIKQVLERIVNGVGLEEAIRFEKKDMGSIEEKIMNIIKSKPGLNFNAYMGLVMKELGGAISGKEASEIIKKYVK